MTLLLLILLVTDLEPYVTRRPDVGGVACEQLPQPPAEPAVPDAFPLRVASGDPGELAIPADEAAIDTPRLRNLAEARSAARERLQAWIDENAAAVLERRDAGVVRAGQMIFSYHGQDATTLEPLDPASTPEAPAFAGDSDQVIRRLFRCRQSETEHDIDPALIALLAEASYFFQAPVELVSGYRARRFSRRSGSRHIVGHASDVRFDGIPMDVVADFFTTFSDGVYGPMGVGRYPRDGFVHVDTRDETFFWTERRRRPRRPVED